MDQIDRPANPIRSFILRGGKLTVGQARALEQFWPRYGISLIDHSGTIDFSRVFDRVAPTILEIGFGDGEALLEVAQLNPQNNYIGIEVHRPGVGHLFIRINQHQLTNIKVFAEDAVAVLHEGIKDESLDQVCLFFPDPWPKKKHHKRRIVQESFINLIARKLRPGGVFHFATDWQDYAIEAQTKLDSSSILKNIAGQGCFSPRLDHRPETRFERRGRRLGHGIWDIIMEKNAD